MKNCLTDANKQQINSYLQRISNILLINGGFLNNPGLYTGEMGIALFFARYARYTQNELYSDYSFDLIEKIQNNIHQETSIDYKQGLAGIGSTIEYLIQNNFFEADTDDLLEDFDKRIFSTYNLPFLPDEKLLGIGYYALWRMSGSCVQKDWIRQTILQPVEKNLHDRSVIPAWLQSCRKNIPPGMDVNSFDRFFEPDHTPKNYIFDISALDLGFLNGLAGLGLSLLTGLDGDDSCFSLFPNDF